MARASATAEYPPSLRLAAAHAAGLSRVPLTELEEKEELARQKQLIIKIQEMEKCKTDLDLIQYMDQHVFSMVSPESPTSDALNIKGKKYIFPSTSYADLLAEGMRILSKIFKDLSGTLAIFERVKYLGPESYVVGCSVAVYNHVLEVKWEAYRDIHKIEDILEEMHVNGIEGDLHTVEILRTLSKDCLRMSNEGPGVALNDYDKQALVRVDGIAAGMAQVIRAREMEKVQMRKSGMLELTL
ncbi:hypothetical protein BDZ91DRAFT_737860 [Kalaharituber pfeilii]|nr:hypothetical protein BDZ91DRAFT_737860 [Kalaharituber pfeilii]